MIGPSNVFDYSFKLVVNWAMKSTANVLHDLSCIVCRVFFGLMIWNSFLSKVQCFVPSGKNKTNRSRAKWICQNLLKVYCFKKLFWRLQKFSKEIAVNFSDFLWLVFQWYFHVLISEQSCVLSWIGSCNSSVVDLVLSSMHALATISPYPKISTNLSTSEF